MTVGKQERDVTDNKMLSVIPVAGIFFKFLLFNAIWCYYTTFTPFSCWESYATAFVATLLLSVPYILTRHIAAGVLVMSVLDIWMVANLMYLPIFQPFLCQVICWREILQTSCQA